MLKNNLAIFSIEVLKMNALSVIKEKSLVFPPKRYRKAIPKHTFISYQCVIKGILPSWIVISIIDWEIGVLPECNCALHYRAKTIGIDFKRIVAFRILSSRISSLLYE